MASEEEVPYERHDGGVEQHGILPPLAAAILTEIPKWKIALLASTGVVAVAALGTVIFSSPRVAVGAYYYPWYGDDFHGGDGYVRKMLEPPQYPTLGEYNDQDSTTIAQHLSWSRQANINLWVVSWWGEGSDTDSTVLNYILPHKNLGDMHIAVHYETLGLTNGASDFDSVGSHIEYLAASYFEHPNYFRIDGRPVIFIYSAGYLYLQGQLDYMTGLMREAAESSGHNIYIVGDGAFGEPEEEEWVMDGIRIVDGLTCYDAYGSMGATGYAGLDKVDQFYASQDQWRSLAHKGGVDFFPVVTPGFNDVAVRDGHAPLSRKLTKDADFGSLFEAMLRQAVNLVDDSTGRLLMVVSFNEWHEDTQIEPVEESEATSEDVNGQGYYTNGLEYEGYGEKYLDILKEYT